MQTTTATYIVNVTTDDENIITFYKTMPTKPKTSKGIKAQNTKLSKWVEREYPNFTSYDITPVWLWDLKSKHVKSVSISSNMLSMVLLGNAHIQRLLNLVWLWVVMQKWRQKLPGMRVNVELKQSIGNWPNPRAVHHFHTDPPFPVYWPCWKEFTNEQHPIFILQSITPQQDRSCCC